MYSPPQSPPTSPPRTYTASLGDRDYDEERKDDSMRSDPSSVISTASVLGTYGDETRRAVVRDVDESGEKIVVEFSPTPRSASQVSSMFARDVSFVSRPAKPHALAHLLPPKLGDALGRTVNLEDGEFATVGRRPQVRRRAVRALVADARRRRHDFEGQRRA